MQCCLRTLAFLLLCASLSSAQQMWVIDTYAGGGPNQVPAATASIGSLYGVATDSLGNVYFTTSLTNQVVEITGGQLLVVAGVGAEPAAQSFANAGDGGPATLASLVGPFQLTVDSSGAIYIPDNSYGRIRKVDTNGVITTVAGSGATTNVGGCVFDGDGPTLLHTICSPYQVVFDVQGNMYIDDAGNNRIRKVDAQGNMTTVAGNGALNVYGQCVFDGDGPATSHALCGPRAIALDGNGNLYIADVGNLRIREVDASGNITTIAGDGTASSTGDGGPAINATVGNLGGLVFDSAGNLYLSDSCFIRKIDTAGNISVFAGTGNCTFNGDGLASQQNICPEFIAIDASGNFFLSENDTGFGGRVRKIDTQGNLTTLAGDGTSFGVGTGQLALNEPMPTPIGVAVDPGGNVYVNPAPGYSPDGILKVNTSGVVSSTQANAGGGIVGFNTAWAWTGANIAVDGSGNIFSLSTTAVLQTNTNGITTTLAGTQSCQFDGDGPATSHSMCDPTGIALDSAGNLYIADTNNCMVRKIDGSGNLTTVAGTGTIGHPSCAFDGDGPATSHSLNQPAGIALDGQGNLYVADVGNRRVRQINLATSALTTIAGSGMVNSLGQCVFDGDGLALQHSLCVPFGIAADPSGNVFVSDPGTIRVREVSGGNITTIAGNGTLGFVGEASAASSSVFENPLGLALDGSGNLYITDTWNDRVRRLSLSSFVLTPSQTSSTVTAGGSATYGVQFLAASGFAGTISLSCTGAPQGATCAPSSSSVSLSSGGSSTATFTVTTTGSTARTAGVSSWLLFPPTPAAYIVGLAGLIFLIGQARRARLGLVFATLTLLTLSACGGSNSVGNGGGSGGGGNGGGGGGGGNQATPVGVYELTLTASLGSNTRSTVVTLKVQ